MFDLSLKYLDSVAASAWKKDKAVDENEILWIPILTFRFDSSLYRIIGISNIGFWIAQWDNGNIEIINSRDKCLHLLVCLQKERKAFFDLLTVGINNATIDIRIAETFPVTELIKFAMGSSTYWANEGVHWLQEEDLDPEFEQIIERFVQDKHFPQEARHRAFNILKRAQKKR